MPQCCRCNAGGKCVNCVCVRSRRQCSNCLPSRKGCCSNMKLSPALQPLVTAQVLPALSVQGQPSLPTSANPSEPSAAAPSEAAIPPATTNTQETDHPQFPPNEAHHRRDLPNIPAHVEPPPLPPVSPMPKRSFRWGEYDAEYIIHSLDEIYSEVVHWKKNTFLVPFGNAGKGLVLELSRLFRAYAEGSTLESITLKACILLILLLQKPFRSSKQKDHSVCLARRLSIWKNEISRNF